MVEGLSFIPIILLIVSVVCLYFMFRSCRVFNLRNSILDKANPEKDNFWGIMDVHDIYSYDEMMFSFRSIKSFREELFHKIKLTQFKGDAKNG